MTEQNLIEKVLHARGITVERLAEDLGYEPRTLKRIQSGEVRLSQKLETRLRQEMGQGFMRQHQILEPRFDAVREDGPSPRARMIPILSLVQAGQVTEYEPLPQDWQEQVATDCPNRKAFALEVRGDSMEPKFVQGTIITVMPEEEPYDGCLVVAKLVNGEAAFKIFHRHTNEITLTSYNPAFPSKTRDRQEFEWIWPVYESRQKHWP